MCFNVKCAHYDVRYHSLNTEDRMCTLEMFHRSDEKCAKLQRQQQNVPHLLAYTLPAREADVFNDADVMCCDTLKTLSRIRLLSSFTTSPAARSVFVH